VVKKRAAKKLNPEFKVGDILIAFPPGYSQNDEIIVRVESIEDMDDWIDYCVVDLDTKFHFVIDECRLRKAPRLVALVRGMTV
jgi:hypothetical protein